jgi:hypothetical protein
MSTNRSKDRASLCSFMFVDGRRCRIPRRVGHPYLCVFHARKEAQTLAGQAAGRDIAYYFSGDFASACDLSSALGRLFSAVVQGQVKPKTASTLAYLGQTLVQALQLSQDEYISAFGAPQLAGDRSHFVRPGRRALCAASETGASGSCPSAAPFDLLHLGWRRIFIR